MGSMTARRMESGVLEPRAKHPHYTRGLLWDNEDDVQSTTAQYSLTTVPVPHVPFAESSNPTVQKTITDHPHLFKVDCHINVDHFEELLLHHRTSHLYSPCAMPSAKVFGRGLTQELAFTQTRGISQTDRLNQKSTWISSVRKLRPKFSLAVIQRCLAPTYCQACTPPLSMQLINWEQPPFT